MREVKIIRPSTEKVIRNKSIIITKTRVASYSRVSTDSEEQKNSYESQLKYYSDLIASKDDWELVDNYADEAISGTQVYKRTDFQRMINDALNGKIDMIITKSISRFARNTLDTLKYVRMLKEKNVAVLFEKENINTLTMNGELLLVILSSVAQQESESIAGNVKIGLKMKMSRGELVGFNNCLGYDYDKETKTLSINEEESKVVQYIFDRYVHGMGCYVIAKELTELGYLNSKGKNHWHENSVRGIIKNEKYKGDLLLGKTFTTDPITHRRLSNMGESEKYYVEDHHEPIVSKEVWDEAQRIMKKRNKKIDSSNENRLFSKKHAFSSVIKCGDCGATYVRRTWNASNPSKKVSWSCHSRVKSGRNVCPKSQSVSEDLLKKAFLEAYSLVIHNDKKIIDNLIDIAEIVLKEESDISRLKNKENEKIEIKKKIEKLIDLKLEEGISEEIYNEKIQKLENKYNSITEEILKLGKISDREKEVKETIRKIRNKISNLNEIKEFDREVFEYVIEKVIIGCYNDDGTFEDDKIVFIFRTGSEISGKIQTTKKKNIIDKYEEFEKNLCLNSTNNINNLCLTTTNDACGECSVDESKKIVEILEFQYFTNVITF